MGIKFFIKAAIGRLEKAKKNGKLVPVWRYVRRGNSYFRMKVWVLPEDVESFYKKQAGMDNGVKIRVEEDLFEDWETVELEEILSTYQKIGFTDIKIDDIVKRLKEIKEEGNEEERTVNGRGAPDDIRETGQGGRGDEEDDGGRVGDDRGRGPDDIGNGVSGGDGKGRYHGDGIQLAREEYTQIPEGDHISKDVARHLRAHQRDFVNLAVEHLKSNKAIFNFDGTGAGKTRQELALAKQFSGKGPVVIVTESESIIDNAFLVDAETMGIKIKKLGIKEDWDWPDNGIFVTTYGRLKDHRGDPPGMVIFDECHNLKNAKSQKYQAAAELVKKSKKTAYFSATPIDKAVHVRYIAEAIGVNYGKIMDKLGYRYQENPGAIKGGKWVRSVPAEEFSRRLESLFTYITKKGGAVKREVSMDNMDLTVNVSTMSQEDMDVYRSVESRVMNMAKKHQGGYNKAVALMALRRLNEGLKVRPIVQSIKSSLSNGGQSVVFVERVEDTDIPGKGIVESTIPSISKALGDESIQYGVLTGSLKKKERAALIDKFQSGEIKVLITTPGSGGTGINLDDTSGNTPRKAIIATPPFSSLQFVQMVGRINRLTTKSRSSAEVIASNTGVDAWNSKIIMDKLKTLGASVGGDYQKIAPLLENDEASVQYLKESAAESGESIVAVTPDPDMFDFIPIGQGIPVSIPERIAPVEKPGQYRIIPDDYSFRLKFDPRISFEEIKKTVEQVKMVVPKNSRSYDAERKEWTVANSHYDVVTKLLDAIKTPEVKISPSSGKDYTGSWSRNRSTGQWDVRIDGELSRGDEVEVDVVRRNGERSRQIVRVHYSGNGISFATVIRALKSIFMIPIRSRKVSVYSIGERNKRWGK